MGLGISMPFSKSKSCCLKGSSQPLSPWCIPCGGLLAPGAGSPHVCPGASPGGVRQRLPGAPRWYQPSLAPAATAPRCRPMPLGTAPQRRAVLNTMLLLTEHHQPRVAAPPFSLLQNRGRGCLHGCCFHGFPTLGSFYIKKDNGLICCSLQS